MGHLSFTVFAADAIVLAVLFSAVQWIRGRRYGVRDAIVGNLTVGTVLAAGLFVLQYWYGSRGDSKPQAWFVQRAVPVQDESPDVYTLAGPFRRQSECIATLEDPLTGQRRVDDTVDCALDDADSKISQNAPSI